MGDGEVYVDGGDRGKGIKTDKRLRAHQRNDAFPWPPSPSVFLGSRRTGSRVRVRRKRPCPRTPGSPFQDLATGGSGGMHRRAPTAKEKAFSTAEIAREGKGAYRPMANLPIPATVWGKCETFRTLPFRLIIS